MVKILDFFSLDPPSPTFKLPNLSAYEAAKTPPSSKKRTRVNVESPNLMTSICTKESKSDLGTASYLSNSLDTSDDSPIFKKKRKPMAILSQSILVEEKNSQKEKDSDLEPIEIRNSSMDEEDSPLILNKKRKRRNCEFLDVEADVSDDGAEVSHDEEDSEDLDQFEASFVDNATQHVSVDQRAMYLKSIKSPERNKMPDKFRLKPVNMADIYSQAVVPDDDSYGDDSFVVDNSDEIEYDEEYDTLDLIADAEIHEDHSKKKSWSKEEKTLKKRKIIYMAESSEDEEEKQETKESVKEDSAKLARLEKQRKLKEEFQKKLIDSKRQESTSITTSPKLKCEKPKANEDNVDKAVVFVSASEIHKSAEVISCLKHVHNLVVYVRSFGESGKNCLIRFNREILQ